MRKDGTLQLLLKAVWRREQLIGFAEGGLRFLRWLVPMLIGGIGVDWLVKLPPPARVLLLLVIVIVPLVKAWRAGWSGLRAFDATRTALQVERQKGGMQSLLVTAVELAENRAGSGTSTALMALARQQAGQAIADIKARDTIRFVALRRPTIIAAVIVGLVTLLSVSHGPILRAGFGRFFTPWLAIDYPTRTHIEVQDADPVVQEGTPVALRAAVTGVIPRQAKIYIRTGKERTRLRRLPIINGKCEYAIETAYRGFDYRLKAGDCRTDWHTVTVIPPPAIQQAELTLAYPDYINRAQETCQALTVTVPETTTIAWKLRLDHPVRQAQILRVGDEPLDMDVSDDGLQVSFEQVAEASRAYRFKWVERDHGFMFTSPSYYLQVAPDRAPRVELTSPSRNLYATLGRKVELAFRGGDDHGVESIRVNYRVNKTEEVDVPVTLSKPVDGSEQLIDWDYRMVLTNLVVGDSLRLGISLYDAYPGEQGGHCTRSQTRRIEFMSKADYLAQIERQRKRLLARLKTLYREERNVYEAVVRLDASDPVFVQTCQLEAVRQDMMRERLQTLSAGMHELTEDLAANAITNQSMTATLLALRTDIMTISTQHVAQAASALRSLAGVSSGQSVMVESEKAAAAYRLDTSARELGLLVLQLGFEEAADVMARELHAAAQTQAALRLRVTMSVPSERAEVADAQMRLANWLGRLFAASPKDRESTVTEALIEFTLTRLVKQMVNGGLESRLREAAELVKQGKTEAAAERQAEIIQILLQAEFKLRVGAEREALVAARDLFMQQADAQKKLRVAMMQLETSSVDDKIQELVDRQMRIHRDFQLLLMPSIAPRRARLFDAVMPSAPPVAIRLGDADVSMNAALVAIRSGNREAAEAGQKSAEAAFNQLAVMCKQRITEMTQRARLERLTYAAQEIDERLSRYVERQLSLLEKAEDAAADKQPSAYLSGQQMGLLDAIRELQSELYDQVQASVIASEQSEALPARLGDIVELMRNAVPLLEANAPNDAAELQDLAVVALSDAQALLAEHKAAVGAYAAMIAAADAALLPSPYVGEIENEQRDMMAVTEKTSPEALPGLSIPQKNLVHAVDAILTALDPIEHMIKSGTIMMFAKEDMDAAGTAMQEKDPVEALDAQDYIIETLQSLREKIDKVVPQYQYLLELVEALHETVQDGIRIRERQRRLAVAIQADAAQADRIDEQIQLRADTSGYGKQIKRITGIEVAEAALQQMDAAIAALKTGDNQTASADMLAAVESLKDDKAVIETLMSLLPQILAAPEIDTKEPDEVLLLKDVLAMAALHKQCYRQNGKASTGELKASEARLSGFAKACDDFIEKAKTHRRPDSPDSPGNLDARLISARQHLMAAAAHAKAVDRGKTVSSQLAALNDLRHFIVDYTVTFITVPGPPPPADPAPSDDFNESEDMFNLFMPGAVSGIKPPDGRQDWEVLGNRERASLNENFARELPLEYRAILKDYYERLAQ
jgi:hypothetical protein